MERHCGAKNILKPKCKKHLRFGALLDVEMLKSARGCGAKIKVEKSPHVRNFGSWAVAKVHEARLEVKLLEMPRVRSSFGSWDVEQVHAAAARSTCGSENTKSTTLFGSLLDVRLFYDVLCSRHNGFCTSKKSWNSKYLPPKAVPERAAKTAKTSGLISGPLYLDTLEISRYPNKAAEKGRKTTHSGKTITIFSG